MFKRAVIARTSFFPELASLFSKQDWIMDYLSLADFFLYEMMFYYYGYCPEILSDPELLKYM